MEAEPHKGNIAIGYGVTPRKSRGLGYWLFFFGPCLIVGLPVANILDDSIKMHLRGTPADGGATILSLFAVVPATIIVALAKPKWWVALLIGITCSPLAVLALYFLWP
jgi:UDP-N-acetylmuramyl pentapeptide phosphotransferase/UDP-N-acetylglucosamine-1-phosphate transferase